MALANVPRWGNLLYWRATKGTHIDMTKPQGTEMAKLWLRLCIKNANSKNYHAHIINLLRNKIILQIFSANRFNRRYACLTVCDCSENILFCIAHWIHYRSNKKLWLATKSKINKCILSEWIAIFCVVTKCFRGMFKSLKSTHAIKLIR